MKRISPQTEERIVDLWFSGIPRDEIAQIVGVSGSTVSAVVGHLPDSLRGLRALSVELTKNNASLPEALKRTKFLSQLTELGLKPNQLQVLIDVVKKSSAEARYQPKQVIKASIKLSNLERKSGKTYSKAIKEFEAKTNEKKKLDEKVSTLKSQVRNLEKKYETIEKELEATANETKRLKEKSERAQRVLDTLADTKEALLENGLHISDFKTIKNFLSEIKRLGEDPTRTVEILRRTSSLEGELEEKAMQSKVLVKFNELENRVHNDEIREFEKKRDSLEKEIQNKKVTLGSLSNEETEKRRRIEGLKQRMQGLEMQVDGLIQKQAALLGVQHDIDEVSQALPARKKELERVEQQITEGKTLITAAEAIGKLLSKKPYDRDAIIQWLQLTKHATTFKPIDELARQIIIKRMAEQGFVPVKQLEAVEKNAEQKLSACNAEVNRWKGIAGKRLDELKEFQEQLKKLKADINKKLDESIDKRIANLIVEVERRITTS